MSKAVLAARIILGLIFFVFGLNGFLHFIPLGDMPQPALDFMGALAGSGYLLTLIKITETVCGFLLLIGKRVPLALTILAPIVINILLFHIFLAPDPVGLGMAVFIVILEVFLAWAYRESFRGVLHDDAPSI